MHKDLKHKLRMQRWYFSPFVSFLSGKFIFGRFIVIANLFAALVSWSLNEHVGWMLFHYVFGFWYLFYSLLCGRFLPDEFNSIVNYYFG